MSYAQAASSLRDAIGGAAEQIRAEQRWLGLMRLVVGASFVAWALFFLFTLPGAPFASSLQGNESASALRFLLLIAGLFGTVAYFVVWRPTLRHESSMEFLRVFLGAGLLVRSARQFKSRLSGECARSAKNDYKTFSLIVVKLAGTTTGGTGRQDDREFEDRLAAVAVRGLARTGDVVGDASPDEVWMLAVGAGDDARESIERRIAARLASDESGPVRFAGARLGGATFGPDGRRPRDLFANAYQRLLPIADAAQAKAA
jgi:hypothetical protein